MMSPIGKREALLYLSNKYQGNWFKILEAVKKKESFPTDEEIAKYLSETKSMFVELTSEDYPSVFHSCQNPPFLLYYYGNKELFNARYRITCIGTRKPSIYQIDTCRKIIMEAEEHFDNQLVVVSGLAYGLDQVCMEAAMDCNAPVIAVLGSGIDKPYPEDNRGIYDYCKSGKGLVISEYPGLYKGEGKNFIFRNRILACLSPLIFVGGGKARSGTSTTVSMGLELGKEILALPCNVTGDDLTNILIKEGASSILSGGDLIKEVDEICF